MNKLYLMDIQDKAKVVSFFREKKINADELTCGHDIECLEWNEYTQLCYCIVCGYGGIINE